MANQLNIKAEETYRLAWSLAAITGESLTAAVTEALKERLEREQQRRDRTLLKARLLHLAAEIRASLRRDRPRSPARDGLYDDHGLPR